MIRLLMASAMVLWISWLPAQTAVLIDFESSGLDPDSFVIPTIEQGDTAFIFQDVIFPSRLDSQFGFWISGWALSTSRNDSVGNFTNLYGSVTGGGDQSNTYMIGQNGSYILLPAGAAFEDARVTNTTYTATALREGTAFSRAFGVDSTGVSGYPDSLVLRVEAYSNETLTHRADIYLADYRPPVDSLDRILTAWVSMDQRLPPLAGYAADSVSFTMYSSDRGSFGNNTPDFFALDNLRIRLDVSSILQIADSSPLTAWPNPASSFVQIGNGGGLVNLFIANSHGQVVLSHPSYQLGQALALEGLAPGLYYAVAVSKHGQSACTIVLQ